MPITSAEAQKVVDAGVAKAQALSHRITIAVVDAAGEVVALGRMDGAGPFNFDLAYGTAYTSALWGWTGDELARLQDTQFFQASSVMRGGRMMVARGSLPIKRGDEVIGALGVSGAPEDIDLEIAEAGLAAFG